MGARYYFLLLLLKESLQYLKESLQYLKESLQYLKESLQYLKELLLTETKFPLYLNKKSKLLGCG